MYNILWIDDEHEKLNSFKTLARLKGIELFPYKSAQLAIKKLNSPSYKYDAILLDAIFYKEEDDSRGSESLDGLIETMNIIENLVEKIPYFIFTGQVHLEDAPYFKAKYAKYYRKAIDSDIDNLLKDIIYSCENLESYRIKEKYAPVFSIIEKHLGDDILELMIELLAETEAEKAGLSRADFNDIRKVIERVFKVLYNMKLIPTQIYEGKGSITGCNRYICHHPKSLFQSKHEITSPTTRHILKGFLPLIQDGSHGDGTLPHRVNEHVKKMNTPYLYRSCIFQLLEIVIWFGGYLDSNPSQKDWIEKENSLPNDFKDAVSGRIEQDDKGNFHCQGILLPYIYTSENFSLGDYVKAYEITENKIEHTKLRYPEYAAKIIRLTKST